MCTSLNINEGGVWITTVTCDEILTPFMGHVIKLHFLKKENKLILNAARCSVFELSVNRVLVTVMSLDNLKEIPSNLPPKFRFWWWNVHLLWPHVGFFSCDFLGKERKNLFTRRAETFTSTQGLSDYNLLLFYRSRSQSTRLTISYVLIPLHHSLCCNKTYFVVPLYWRLTDRCCTVE